MKTYNRIPASVSIPTTKQLGIKYFNYTSWKGKCTDKNYIGVDQETFEECNNVYIDEDNVLRSRPAIKASVDNNDYEYIWTFGPWTVYMTLVSTGTNLIFVKTGYIGNKTLENVPTDCNVVLADEKIFVFGNNYAKYFDTVTETFADATDLIYSPVTKTITVSGENELESPNMWSKTHRERYIWERKAPVDLTNLVCKKVTVQVGDNGEEHTISSFQKYQEYTIAKEIMDNQPLTSLYYPIESYNTDGTPVRVQYISAIPMIDVSRYNSIVRGKIVPKTVSGTVYNYYEIEYSVDGIIFSKLNDLPWTDSTPYDCYYIPKFSDDGTIVYVYTSAGIYAISVLSDSDDGSYKYSDWNNICTTFGISKNVIFKEVGAAFVRNYNTFAVFTGEESATSGLTNLYSVSNGTLKSGQSSAVDTHQNRHSKIFTDETNVVLLQSYLQNSVAGYSIYAYNAETLASVAIGGIKTIYAGDVNSALGASIYKGANISVVVKRTADSLTLSKLTTNVTTGAKEFTSETIPTNNLLTPVTAESDNSILTQITYIYNKQTILFNQGGQYSDFPIAVKNGYIYFGYFDTTTTYKVYSTYFSDKVYFTETVTDKASVDYRFDSEAELSHYYISKGKDLYITDTGAYQKNDFEWYFPEKFVEHFDYEITGIHPISTTEIAVFTQNSIFYVVPTTVNRTVGDNTIEQTAFAYYKSRIPLGCNKGCDIVTSYDGKYTMFATKRGLVAMAYQDFVSSSEQALTFLSDNISEEFFNWNEGAIKITMYKYWAVVYRTDIERAYVLDMRNSSWWVMTYAPVEQVVEINRQLHLISGNRLHYMSLTEQDYRDDIGRIDWILRSQKLHFSAVNYYKQIQNLTLSAVSQVDAIDDPVTYSLGVDTKLDVTNYRKTLSGETDQSVHYQVNLARTYVARLNYLKVNEFQFALRSNEMLKSQLPLMLTNIAIKFKITGQVR